MSKNSNLNGREGDNGYDFLRKDRSSINLNAEGSKGAWNIACQDLMFTL